MLIKYIDNFNAVEKIFKINAVLQLSQKKPASGVRVIKSEVLYDEVKNRAASIGMRVNSKKTQMLCIAPTGASDVSTFIESRSDGEIGSGTELGFFLGRALMLTPTLPR